MSNPFARLLMPMLVGGILAVAALCTATAAQAVMLVELSIDATARPYGPGNPVASAKQQFSVPDGPGKLIMTYTEDRYVGGPGGFTLEPADLSNEHLGWGGSTVYTPHDPVKGQPYRVQTIWLNSFSKKMWVATLTAHHVYQAFQVRGRGQQMASSQRLTVEFVPGTPPASETPKVLPPQNANLTGSWNWGAGGGIVEILPNGTGHDSRGNTMQWTLRDPATGLYELRWSHGYTDTATLAPDGRTVVIVNNVGTRFTATRRSVPAPQSANLTGNWDWGAGGGIVEILPNGTGHDSRGNTMRWTLRDAASRSYELRWSHGYTDAAVLAADGNTVTIINNVGTRFTATRRNTP